ncbi:MAG: hypothetical protein SVJ22_02935 [Halobacteriota archaeon]|nr:hypothetical protein [Halobacteriota archaeon]
MAILKRPFQDETLFSPCQRNFYNRTTIGRPGDPREEPIKYTQAINDEFHADIWTEWMAREAGCAHISKAIHNGELDAETEAMKKIDGFMEATGVSEDFIKGTIDSGADGALATAESKLTELGEDTALDMVDEILTEDMETEYGIFPPCIPVPQRVIAPAMSVIYGPSSTVCYYHLDQYTNEFLNTYFTHVEDGLMTTGHGDVAHYDFEKIFAERRHLRTGEKLKFITVQRPAAEGLGMVSDILKDLRNEVSPEYAIDPLYIQSVTAALSTGYAQYPSRALLEIIHFLYYWSGGSILRGFPFWSLTTLYPVPGVMDLLLQLPLDMLGPRFIGLFAGVNAWLPGHIITHSETRMEVFGEMMIPPTYNESVGAYFTYGMDVPRYPPTFKLPKYLYGLDAQVREPTEYPCPERKIMGIGEAEEAIYKARIEHPEWLTGR